MQLTLSKSRSNAARSEHALVAAARGGDERAFEELYAKYRQRIFAFIVSKIHDHGRAEDIAQEVFISALRRLHASDQPISFKPWIYEIAKNACIDEFRRGSRSREVPLQTDENLDAGERPMISLVPTPPRAVENKQRLDDLRGAFGGLSESHHQLVVLREFEGLSYEEIGDRLGMTREMVQSSLFRARRKLTVEYDELASGRRCQQIQTVIDSGAAQSIAPMGIRERRRLGRHLAHCQTCRHTARLAGVDEALLKPRSIPAKIAALFPFPLLRRPSGPGRGQGRAGARSGSHHTMTATGAAHIAQPAGFSMSLGQAAAAAAALAIAGAGTGLVVGAGHHQHSSRPSAAALGAEALHSRQQRSSARAGSATPASGASQAKRTKVAGAASGGASAARLPGTRPRRGRDALGHRTAGPGRTSPGSAAGSRSQGRGNATASSGSSVAGSIHSAVSGVTGTVGATVSGVKKTVGSTVSGAEHTVGSSLSGVKNTAGSVGRAVGRNVAPVTSGSTVGKLGSTVGKAGSTVGKAGSTVGKAGSTAGNAVRSVTGSSSPTSGVGAAAHSVTAPAKSVVPGLP